MENKTPNNLKGEEKKCSSGQHIRRDGIMPKCNCSQANWEIEFNERFVDEKFDGQLKKNVHPIELMIFIKYFIEQALDDQKNETLEMLESIENWPEPQAGAGQEIGALCGVGMYMQYAEDRKKHKKQIEDLKEKLTKKI